MIMMIPCYVYCALVHNDVDQDQTCLTKFDVKYLCFFSYFAQKNKSWRCCQRVYLIRDKEPYKNKEKDETEIRERGGGRVWSDDEMKPLS